MNDLLYALRSLRRTPGFTLTAILTLALGIGLAAAVFTVADALLLHAWLKARLDNDLALDQVEREELELVAVDGEELAPPRSEPQTPSDLLSNELDHYARDPVYEQAVRTAAEG